MTHTIDRQRTSASLLRSAVTRTYDPLVDIDWDAPLDPDRFYLPTHRSSLYGTPLWDQLSREQRIELTKHELASLVSMGIWFETILMQMLVRRTYDRDPRGSIVQFSYTEIGDECRHSVMFGKTLERIGAPFYRPRRYLHELGRFFKATANGTMCFAGALFVEEVLDQLQREAIVDESLQPLVRMVSHVHVVEEARHMRFARAEAPVAFAHLGRSGRAWTKLMIGAVAYFAGTQLVHRDVYAVVGLDPVEAEKVAHANPHWRRTRAWAARRVVATLDELGLISGPSARLWRRAGLLDDFSDDPAMLT
ncbi:MAG: AurF N-oxygenase family protein [Nocardioidaceae bacterium]